MELGHVRSEDITHPCDFRLPGGRRMVDYRKKLKENQISRMAPGSIVRISRDNGSEGKT
jgi:hypothetical protein